MRPFHRLLLVVFLLGLLPLPTADGAPPQRPSAPVPVARSLNTGIQPAPRTQSLAFPSTAVLDSFTRADGAVGANWAGATGDYSIAGNALDGDGGALHWNTAFAADQEAFFTLPTIDTGASEIDLLLKSQGTGECDLLEVFYDADAELAQVWTCHDAGTWMQHGDDIPLSLAPGDQLGARALADGTVAVYHNGSLADTVSVSSGWPFRASSGRIGVWLIDAGTTTVDDFGGGTFSTSPPPTNPTLQVTGTPATGAISITAAGRFTLVFDAAHNWQAGAWYDLASNPTTNLARANGSALNYNVIQSPLELYDGDWNNLSTALTPTLQILAQTEQQVALRTGWIWQTPTGSTFAVSSTQTINTAGIWQVQTVLTNRSGVARTFGDGERSLEYAFTNPSPQLGWDETLASDSNRFTLSRSDGPEPFPAIAVQRSGAFGVFDTDGDLNRYWKIPGNMTLPDNGTWAASWTNQLWFGPTTPINAAPTVDAGPHQALTLPTDTAILSGTVQDDGLPSETLVYTWTVDSGPGTVAFADAQALDTSATFSEAGVYRLRLSADDGQVTRSDDLLVAVLGANQAPVVDAGADRTISSTLTLLPLVGTVQDDGLPLSQTLSLAWELVSGPGTVTFDTPDQATTIARLSAPGSYVLRFSADDTALDDSDDLTVIVLNTATIPSTSLILLPWNVSGANDQIWRWTNGTWTGLTPPHASWYWLYVEVNPFDTDQWLLLGNARNDGQINKFDTRDGLFRAKGTTVSPAYYSADAGQTWTEVDLPHPFTTDETSGFYACADISQVHWSTQTPDSWQAVGFSDSHCPNTSYVWWGTADATDAQVDAGPVMSSGQAFGPSAVGLQDDAVFITQFPGSSLLRVMSPGASGWTTPSGSSPGFSSSGLTIERAPGSSPLVALMADNQLYVTDDYRTGQPSLQTSGTSGSMLAGLTGDRWYVGGRTGGIVQLTDLSGTISAQTVTTTTEQIGFIRSDRQTRSVVGARILIDASSSSSTDSYLSVDGSTWQRIAGPPSVLAAQLADRIEVIGPYAATPPAPTPTPTPGGPTLTPTPTSTPTPTPTPPPSPSSDLPLAIPGWIGGPVNQSTLTGQVPITLTQGITLTGGTLDYWPADDPEAVTTLASSISGSGGATLATLDTTTLANGSYVIRLVGQASDGTTLASGIMVTVSGEYKPGRVRFDVTDLTVPLVGLPITIGRSYDSLERQRSGDFGYGWSLSVGSPRLTTDPAHNVTVTQPNGQRVTFYFTPASYGGVFGFLQEPTYTAEAGVYGSLTSNGCPMLVSAGGRYLCFLDTAEYQPTTYTYTDPYGRVFVMDAEGALQSITDLNQNRLTFDEEGIVSSAGGRSVAFERDGQGRIIEVIDPAGQSYTYVYSATGDLGSVSLPGIATPSRYGYDADHLVTAILDGRGNTAASASYDADGRLLAETDAVGNTTSYTYTLNTRTTTITNPDAGVRTIVADSHGDTLSETDPLSRTTSFTYDANHNLGTRTDALGRATTYTYDDNGHQTSETGPLGATSTTTYNQYGGPTSITDVLGVQQLVSYDASFVPVAITDPLGTRARLSFDSHGSLLSLTDGNGGTTSYTYDTYGNQLTITDPLDRVTSFTYDQLGRRLTQTDALDQTTQYGYDALGHTIAITDALDFVTTSAYDANGNRISQTDARSNTTTFIFDAANRLTNTRFADTSAITSTYDFRGNPLTEVDQLGHVTKSVYDLVGQRTSVTTAFGTAEASTMSSTYNAIGERTATTDARGFTTTTAYADQPLQQTRVLTETAPSPLSYQTVTTLNAAGQLIQTRDASLRSISLLYDMRGRPTLTIHPDSSLSQQTYDGAGNRLSQIDQAGQASTFVYDAANQLLSVSNPLSQTTHYDYDGLGNLASITDARNNTTRFGYDALSRTISETLPLGMTALSTYDEVGNLSSRTDFNGNTTTSSYDLLNQLLTITPDAGLSEPAIGFSYTPTGQRQSMTDGSGTTNYSYDAHDRLLSKAAPQGTLTYSYDATGNLALLRSNHTNGITVTYSYDALNRLSSVVDNRLSPGTSTYVYSPTSTLATLTLPNDVVTRYGYDRLDRLTSLVTKKNTITLASYAYTLRPDGNRSRVVELGGRAVAYSYDAADRLLSEIITGGSPNGTISYSYDAVGNRLSRSSTVSGIGASTATYDANDRLNGSSYDDNGNTASAGGVTYDYDFRDLLTSATGGTAIAYDGDGNRVAETTGGITTTFLIDELNPTGFPQVVEELVGGAVQRTYTYGLDLISQNRLVSATWTPSYHLADGLGSVRTLADASGSATDSYTYDAFGTAIASTGSTPNRYRFTGEQLDADLGMYYLRARYYNQSSGRFWSRDTYPIDQINPREWNRYAYVAGNPVNLVDPSGRMLTSSALSLSRISVPSIPTISSIGARTFVILAVTTYVLFVKIKSGDAHRQEKKQIRSAANQCGVDPRDFGDFIEDYKSANGIPPAAVFAYKTLLALAEIFKEDEGGGC